MELVLVRHGESVGNIVTYDCPDPELTELGKKQAELVSERLANEQFDHIYSSPLIRALETASIIAKNHDNNIEVCTHLRENRSLDNVICLTGEELKKRFPKVIFKEKIFSQNQGWEYVGKETREISYKRAAMVANYIYKNFTNDEKVLIVAHGGFNTSLMSVLLGLEPNRVEFSQNNTCINRLLLQKNWCKILCINDYSHLDGLSKL